MISALNTAAVNAYIALNGSANLGKGVYAAEYWEDADVFFDYALFLKFLAQPWVDPDEFTQPWFVYDGKDLRNYFNLAEAVPAIELLASDLVFVLPAQSTSVTLADPYPVVRLVADQAVKE